jgi:hypothetical protein
MSFQDKGPRTLRALEGSRTQSQQIEKPPANRAGASHLENHDSKFARGRLLTVQAAYHSQVSQK